MSGLTGQIVANLTHSSEALFYSIPPFKYNSVLDGFITQNATAVGVALTLVLLASLYWQALPKPLPGIPYTQKSRWNFFGDALDFMAYTKDTGEVFRWFATKAQELQSPVIQVFLTPFSRPLVIVADTQEIIDMATRRTKEFDRGGFLISWMGAMFPEGTVAMPSHAKFKNQRNIWSSTMTSQFLNSVSAKTIHQHTSSLIDLWSTKTQHGKGRPFEVSSDLKQATFDMIWTAATGDDLGLITRRIKAAAEGTRPTESPKDIDTAVEFADPDDLPEIVHACETLIQHLNDMRKTVWLQGSKALAWMTPSWRNAWKIKEATMTKLIEDSRNRQDEAQCAMDEVFKRSANFEEKGKQTLSHRDMIDETFAYIVGGHETTQDTTKWSMKFLTANQDKQDKLRSALLELFPNANASNLPSFEEIVSSEHNYVEASIQELIRIALTAPAWHRRTTQDVVVLGHHIPAGIDIFGAPSVQSNEDMDDFEIDPKLRSPTSKPRSQHSWERTSKALYQPERWLDDQGNYDAYMGPMLPFGAGPRGCFGQRLARLELRMMIIMLVLSFEFEPVPEAYTSFRAEEIVNRGPEVTYIRPKLRV